MEESRERIPVGSESEPYFSGLFVPREWSSPGGNLDRIMKMGRKYIDGSGIGGDDVLKASMLRVKSLEYAKDLGLRISESYSGGLIPIGASEKFKPDEMLKKAREVLPDIMIPETQTYYQYLRNPYFPVLMKFIYAQRGDYKFLIESEDQLEKMKRFFNSAELTDDGGGRESFNQREGLAEDFEAQQFIETPGDRYTSYRVLITGEGKIIASEMYYSEPKDSMPILQEESKGLGTIWSKSLFDYFVDSGSYSFLGSKAITSNRSRGGNGIVLDSNEYSKSLAMDDAVVLRDHGLDESKPLLPNEIKEQSRALARGFTGRAGLVMGIDWIQESGTGKYYFLEVNPGPGHEALRDTYSKLLENKTEEELEVIMEVLGFYLLAKNEEPSEGIMVEVVNMIERWEKEAEEIIENDDENLMANLQERADGIY